jgi:hypothetical protein
MITLLFLLFEFAPLFVVSFTPISKHSEKATSFYLGLSFLSERQAKYGLLKGTWQRGRFSKVFA